MNCPVRQCLFFLSLFCSLFFRARSAPRWGGLEVFPGVSFVFIINSFFNFLLRFYVMLFWFLVIFVVLSFSNTDMVPFHKAKHTVRFLSHSLYFVVIVILRSLVRSCLFRQSRSIGDCWLANGTEASRGDSHIACAVGPPEGHRAKNGCKNEFINYRIFSYNFYTDRIE